MVNGTMYPTGSYIQQTEVMRSTGYDYRMTTDMGEPGHGYGEDCIQVTLTHFRMI